MADTILVTGGAGYIGSHTCLALLEQGYRVVVADNLSNSKFESIRRVEQICGRSIDFHQIDIADQAAMGDLFRQHAIDAVIHFAGLKAVGESCQRPLYYYRNNVGGSVSLLETMAEHRVKTLVFSSSATVYGDPHTVPILEDFPLQPANPYGRTKLFIEEILRDAAQSDPLNAAAQPWKIAILRYFNPVGAHPSGRIGEDPSGIPNNLMPYLSQVAIGKLQQLSIFGNDYPTPDGTGVRDYIHVMDLAQGHIKALEFLSRQPAETGVCDSFNLGTGKGHSVLEMVQTFERVTGQAVPYRIAPRRAGDVPAYYADPTLAREKLDWRAEKDLAQMVADTWRWQSGNPNGYE